jgi:hypothetical protein
VFIAGASKRIKCRCCWISVFDPIRTSSGNPIEVTPLASSSRNHPDGPACAFSIPGFFWDRADAYLFDIDGTLVRSRDTVHYFAFQYAMRQVFGLQATIDNVPVQGNTDVGSPSRPRSRRFGNRRRPASVGRTDVRCGPA